MNSRIPIPDQLLKAVTDEEQKEKKGKLKIFIGMAAGVGKTYAMLQDAKILQKEKVDVVVGIVNTHGRKETEALLGGLEVIPENLLSYKGRMFSELDTDAILRRRPQLVLVDELAHTNISGSRYEKRWQDVMELLENGINVSTTLNVQHIESLHDIVEGIVGVPIHETVPDHVIEKAASIQLIDLSPEKLLERLKEGKVYLGNQPQIAAAHFFQKENLTALREIVLRYAAEKVDLDLRDMVATNRCVIEWRTQEKLMVAVSPSPSSQKLIRTAKRLTSISHVPWITIFVNDGHVLTENENQQLAKNLALARDLGAEVLTISDPSIVAGIQRIARQQGVTQIIIGRSPDTFLSRLFHRHELLDTLTEECKDIDIHVIRQELLETGYKKWRFPFSMPQKFAPYFIAVLLVILLSGCNWLLMPTIGYKLNGFIFLLSILSMSLFFTKGPVFFSSILYAFIWDTFFIPPSGVLFDEDHILLMFYVLTALTTGILMDRSRKHREILLKSEESTMALYDITRSIANAASSMEMFRAIEERLGTFLNGLFEIIPKKPREPLQFESSSFLLQDDKEKNAALWVSENGKEAGKFTNTLPSCKNFYIPLKGVHEVVGLLAYRPITEKPLSLEEKNFLYAVCQSLAGYLERHIDDTVFT